MRNPLNCPARQLLRQPERLPLDPYLVLATDAEKHSGSTLYDKSIRGNHGDIEEAVWSQLLGSWGLYFDGLDDYVQFSAQVIPNGAKSILAWVKLSANTAYYTVADTNGGSSFKNGLTLGVTDAGHIYIFAAIGGGSAIINTIGSGVGIIDDDVGHLIGLAWDGTIAANKVVVYRDGSVDHRGTSTGVETAASTYDMSMGRLDANNVNNYKGNIGGVEVYGRVLYTEEILARYHAREHLN